MADQEGAVARVFGENMFGEGICSEKPGGWWGKTEMLWRAGCVTGVGGAGDYMVEEGIG